MEADRADQALVGGDSARPSIALRTWVEGWEGVRLYPYDDGSGYITIGCGHRLQDSDPRVSITQAECDALLDTDLLYYANGVGKLIIMPLPQYRFDALTAFAMNKGLGALAGSTLRRLVNVGRLTDAADEFLKWDIATDARTGAKASNPGLAKRSAAERAMFIDGNYGMRP
jgi:lysozyme